MSRSRIEEGIYRRGNRFEVIVSAPTTNGGRRQLTGTARNLREARRVRGDLYAQRSTGDVPSDPKVTVRQLVEAWMEHRRRLGKIRPRTEARYRELLEQHVWPKIGATRAAKLDATRIQAVVDAMAAEGRDPRQTFAILRAALRQATRWKLLPYSPAEGVELPNHRRPELTIPTLDELERLMSGAGPIDEPFRVALSLASVGLRRSEVCGVRWTDVDLSEGTLRVRRGVHAVRLSSGGTELVEAPPKSERSERSVELPTSIVKILERYRATQARRRIALGEAWAADWDADDVVVDNGLGRPMHPDAISQRWRKLRTRAGVRSSVRLHDLRALYVTEALAAGVDAGVVARQVGHARSDFTRDVYQRVRREDAHAVADAIDAALGRALETESVDIALTKRPSKVAALRADRR